MLASAKTTRDPALSPVRAGWFAFPLAPALRSTDSAAVTESGCALFASFPATMTGLDFPRPYIIGYSSSLSRHGPPASSAGGQTWDSFRRDPFARDVLFDPGGTTMPHITASHMLRSTICTVSASAT